MKIRKKKQADMKLRNHIRINLQIGCEWNSFFFLDVVNNI